MFALALLPPFTEKKGFLGVSVAWNCILLFLLFIYYLNLFFAVKESIRFPRTFLFIFNISKLQEKEHQTQGNNDLFQISGIETFTESVNLLIVSLIWIYISKYVLIFVHFVKTTFKTFLLFKHILDKGDVSLHNHTKNSLKLIH